MLIFLGIEVSEKICYHCLVKIPRQANFDLHFPFQFWLHLFLVNLLTHICFIFYQYLFFDKIAAYLLQWDL